MADLSDYVFMKEKKHTSIRVIWYLVYGFFIMLTVSLIINLWREFLTNPTVTTLESTSHPVSKVPFPGVAICNINKISKKRAQIFAQNIAEHVSNVNASEVLNLIPLLGKLYDFDYNTKDETKLTKLQKILDAVHLNTITVMNKLTYTCDDFLIKCKWLGNLENCSRIFKMRLTYDGYCCTFNYVKNTPQHNKVPAGAAPLTGEPGIDRGLYVKINNDPEDYFYTSLSSAGVTVQVFVPTDYPDKPSGSLIEVVARLNTETFVRIKPTTLFTVRDVIEYPLSKRGCLFDEERVTGFHGVYSQSDCNVDCRVASSLALCQCVPFMVPLSTPENVCTLNNLQCLHRYKSKWNTMYPEDDTSGFLQREQHDSLRCTNNCYPSCGGTTYDVISDSAAIHKSRAENQTSVQIYYSERFSALYKQDVVYYWFEILSNFGGTFGLIIGMSLVSIIEFSVFSFQVLRRKTHS